LPLQHGVSGVILHLKRITETIIPRLRFEMSSDFMLTYSVMVLHEMSVGLNKQYCLLACLLVVRRSKDVLPYYLPFLSSSLLSAAPNPSSHLSEFQFYFYNNCMYVLSAVFELFFLSFSAS
jgi:hypothetical protein